MSEQDEKSCCRLEILDYWGEPAIIIGGISAGVALFYAISTGLPVVPWVSGISMAGAGVAEWRVRRLAVAKKLMDSVRDLREENEKLKESIDTLNSEIDEFKGMVGLLGDNVEDIEEAKEQLITLYKQYREENKRYESNNLLTLFGLVDKNEDSKLSPQEIKRMEDYVRIVYGEDFDFDILDRDGDGSVSLKEFFNKFKKHRGGSPVQKKVLEIEDAANLV